MFWLIVILYTIQTIVLIITKAGEYNSQNVVAIRTKMRRKNLNGGNDVNIKSMLKVWFGFFV